ncbi:MAG: septum formation inhibitor [Pseudonocardiales bacterium]|nr:MAG: septum formation inhibitor [Pseudonocardiales bacterium]
MARRAPSAPDASPAARARGRLTGRAAVLGLAVCVVVLTLAYPMRSYLAQRNEIAHLTAQQRAQRGQVTALEQHRRQLDDPAYVKAQARKRLQYVMPGEIGYVVIDPGRQAGSQHGHRPITVSPRGSTRDSPWYSQLWGTVQGADARR